MVGLCRVGWLVIGLLGFGWLATVPVVAQSQLYLPLIGQQPLLTNLTNLTNHPRGGFHPVWSSDGSRIAFVGGDDSNELYVLDIASRQMTQLTNFDLPSFAVGMARPTWSPDGSQIAVTIFSEDWVHPLYRLYLARADGSELVELPIRNREPSPQWSPDGSRLLLIADSSSDSSNLVDRDVYVIRPDGTEARNLTRSGNRYEFQPVWSPDGSQIFFLRVEFNTSEGEPDYAAGIALYAMDADGSHRHRLFLTAANEYIGYLAVSPDGQRLVFSISSSQGSNFTLYGLDADGRNGAALRDFNSSDIQDIAWSPDGSRLALVLYNYGVDVPSPATGLYVINRDGSAPTWLAPIISNLFNSFSWAPDGKRIAFPMSLNANDPSDIYSVAVP